MSADRGGARDVRRRERAGARRGPRGAPTRRRVLAVSLVALAAACGGGDGRTARGDDELARLRAEVDSLRALFEQALVGDTLVRRLDDLEGDILIGIRTPFIQDVARWTARGYLDDVELHLRPDVTVEEGDEVDVKIGPISVHAGDWRVEVTIDSVYARLRADSIGLAVADSNSMSALLVVGVSEARGEAAIHFAWDATTLASVVCRDFEMDETFGGVVEPFTYRVEGRYDFEASPEGILAIPRFERPRVRVSPIPTEASWRRARAILDEQNDIFRCGLALQPDDMIERLDRLLRTGFEFQLPEVLFPSVRLPARIEDRVDLGRRVVNIRNVPVWLEMSPEAIWYGSTLELGPPAPEAPPAESTSTGGSSPPVPSAPDAPEPGPEVGPMGPGPVGRFVSVARACSPNRLSPQGLRAGRVPWIDPRCRESRNPDVRFGRQMSSISVRDGGARRTNSWSHRSAAPDDMRDRYGLVAR